MGRGKTVTASGIVLFQSVLYRGYIGEDGMLRQERDHLAEHLHGLLQVNSIDEEVGGKTGDLVLIIEPPGAEDILHLLMVAVVDGYLIVETERLGQPEAHLAGPEDQDLPDVVFCVIVHRICSKLLENVMSVNGS